MSLLWFLWYLILVQKHVELLYTDSQVSLIELIKNIPPQGSKFPSFLYQSMKETEAVK